MDHDYHDDAFDWKHGRPRPRRHHHDHSDCIVNMILCQSQKYAHIKQPNNMIIMIYLCLFEESCDIMRSTRKSFINNPADMSREDFLLQD